MIGSITVNIKNTDKIKSFTKLSTSTDTILLVYGGRLNFISDDLEVCAIMGFPILSNSGIGDLAHFKIPTVKLNPLLVESTLKITFGNGRILLEFSQDNRDLYSISFDHRLYDLSDLYPKLEILDDVVETDNVYDLNNFGIISRICKSTNISPYFSGVSCDLRGAGYVVYKEVKIPQMKLSAPVFSLLYTHSSKFILARNVVAVRVEELDLVILARKNNVRINDFENGTSATDYEYIRSKGSSTKIRFSLDNILVLSKKVKLNDGDFYLDFHNKQVIFNDNGYEYTSTIDILGIESTNKDYLNDSASTAPSLPGEKVKEKKKLPKFKIPAHVLSKVLTKLSPGTKLVLEVKKDCICLDCDTIYIVFGKEILKND